MDAHPIGTALVADYEAGAGVAPSGVDPDRGGEPGPWLAATLPVLDLAAGSVRALLRAAVRAGATGPLAEAPLDLSRLAASFASDRLLRLDGHPVSAWSPLSGFFRTADGWVRTHANYPHHRHRLLAALGLHGGGSRADGAPAVGDPAVPPTVSRGDGPTARAHPLTDIRAEDFARALASLTAREVEESATAAGAIAVAVRMEGTWRASPQGVAAAEGPLVRLTVREDVGPPRPLAGAGTPLPLAGVRVLDLTRVIAGPIATRALALLGADVLRVDPPVPAEIRWQHLDTGQGKRSTLLDLHDDGDRERAQGLLDAADVLVTGYRPGSLARFGLRVPPGGVRARVSAWGESGPWATRRGFDSIVQAATGIAIIESPGGEPLSPPTQRGQSLGGPSLGDPSPGGEARAAPRPGALPAQALDHATGYLLAAGVLDALAARAADGRGRDVVVSLARTATWLLDAPGRDPAHPPAADPPLAASVSHGHAPEVTTARPAVPGFDDYPTPAHPWATDHATWR
ncbi:CoA transferase [Xylanimonas ulmi]|uniref:CoA transferase family III n=1 Tax=Xylanimonas ulmi TaxID=228973 RepID=A0A4Q7M4H0_9MICO|nr:CoA transferase [Xylanibacterium ulmi]RZS62484.1 CoA transferase family III [Xylanibacterium ulmi]